MIIIFGTGNYFKRQRGTVDGSCEQCGHTGAMHQYDTTGFFYLYWIPVIPLGNKHVLAECPNCHAGREISLGKWRAMQEELDATYEAYEANPDVPARALDAMATAVGTYDQVRFLDLALKTEERFGSDPEILYQLATGYDHFNMQEEAEGACLESLRLKDDHAVRYMLTHLLIRQGRHGEAAPHVEQLIATQDANFSGIPLMYAEALGLAGRAPEALAMLDRVLTLWPHLEKNKPIKKLLKQLKKDAKRQSPAVARTSAAM